MPAYFAEKVRFLEKDRLGYYFKNWFQMFLLSLQITNVYLFAA